MDQMFYPVQLSGSVAAPASKSEAHRRMICAGLAAGESVLDGFMESEDMKATRNCLQALGAAVTVNGDRLTIRGCEEKRPGQPVMDCGESGSTLRFFVPVAMTRAGGGVFRMHGRLGSRPMDIYRDLFVPQGTRWNLGIGADGVAELHVSGRMVPGDYQLPGNVSSQFVSGLLFALPMLEADSTLTVLPPVESAGYIRMTIRALEEDGIRIEERGPWSWAIPGNQRYHGGSGRLHGDYSQAAVLLCAAALGNPITVTGLSRETTQGDRAVLKCLRALGASVTEDADGITVRAERLRGTELDLHDCPDIAPMLALVCQLAEGESLLNGCGRLRLKECDRLTATADLLNALGGNVRVEKDAMRITGVSGLRGGVAVDTCADHRMVMLASIAALRCDAPITVNHVETLAKSWPDYLRVYRALGGRAE